MRCVLISQLVEREMIMSSHHAKERRILLNNVRNHFKGLRNIWLLYMCCIDFEVSKSQWCLTSTSSTFNAIKLCFICTSVNLIYVHVDKDL